MWAHRAGSLNYPSRQDTKAFSALTADDLAAMIRERCLRYTVRVAHVSAYRDGDKHCAIVVFEREPVS